MPWWLNCSEKSSSSSAPNSKMILIHKSVSQIASSPERSQGPLSPFSSPLPRFPYPQELILCFLLSHTAWHKNGWMIFLHTPLYHMIDVTVSLFQFSIQTPLRCRCHGKKTTSDTLRFGVNQREGEIKWHITSKVLQCFQFEVTCSPSESLTEMAEPNLSRWVI